MSNPYKNLSGQAVIYGLGNIVPRLLNYGVLTVYYTRRFPIESYGVITELYAYVAILLIVLTYGMETGLFKFSSDPSKRDLVYSSVLGSVITTSTVFGVFILLFRNNIASWIGYEGNPEYIFYLGLTLSIDAVASVIFARLRIQNKVKKFAFFKILNVVSTVFFVFLFLEILPAIKAVSTTDWYLKYLKNIEVGYVLIANLLSSSLILVLLLSDLKNIRFVIDKLLLKKVLNYSIPLLIVGLAGIFNETIDRILLRYFLPSNVNALYELGIYGANYRIAVLMTIFVQMFRYAAEPFFFNLYGKNDSSLIYANVLKYFTIFLMMIFLGVALGIDFFKLFIDSDYRESGGLAIVPVVLMANVLVGLLFNVNMWYKLSGHTIYGVYITGIGAVITIVLNIIFIPLYSFYACAWIHVVCNAVMLFLTYYFGQKKYKINYDLKSIGLYILVGLILFIVGKLLYTRHEVVNILTGLAIVVTYFWFCNKRENLTGIFLKKHESQNSE